MQPQLLIGATAVPVGNWIGPIATTPQAAPKASPPQCTQPPCPAADPVAASLHAPMSASWHDMA
eukprot:12884937-Prorocentrum_lima.AAC.1